MTGKMHATELVCWACMLGGALGASALWVAGLFLAAVIQTWNRNDDPR